MNRQTVKRSRLRPASNRNIAHVAWVLLVALMLGGCVSRDGKTQFEKEVVAEDVSIAVLRSESFSYMEHFTHKVEATADEIIAATKDPGVKREALLWKIYGIPACLIAQDHPSPLISFVDMWILTVQMRQYFESGEGREVFGPHQTIAITACLELEKQANDLAQVYLSATGYARGAEKVSDFASGNPLDATGFDRPFSPKDIESIITGPDAGLFAVAQNLEVEVQKIQIKLGYYAALLPRVARWQAELFAEDIMENEIAPVIADIRSGISEERQIILDDVNRQREETLAFAEVQKQDALVHITSERQALTADLERIVDASIKQIEEFAQREHETLRQFVDEQRELTLQLIHQERKETVAELASIANNSVDRVYNRLWLVLGVVWFGVAGLIFVARILFKPGKER